MALSNREMVGRGLDLLKKGLGAFVEREYRRVYGDEWPKEAAEVLSKQSLFPCGFSPRKGEANLLDRGGTRPRKALPAWLESGREACKLA